MQEPGASARLIGAAALLGSLLVILPAQARTHTIETRPGFATDVLFDLPDGAVQIAGAAIGSPAAVAMLFTGGLSPGMVPCGVETHHAFYGIEEDVVTTVVDFILRHTPGLRPLDVARPK